MFGAAYFGPAYFGGAYFGTNEEPDAIQVAIGVEEGGLAGNRRNYFVTIDGVDYILGSAAEARQLLSLTDPEPVSVSQPKAPTITRGAIDIDPPVLPPPPMAQPFQLPQYANPQLDQELAALMSRRFQPPNDDDEIELLLQ